MDLAIRHGQGTWSDVVSDFLFAETAMPVCRPGYLDVEDAGADDLGNSFIEAWPMTRTAISRTLGRVGPGPDAGTFRRENVLRLDTLRTVYGRRAAGAGTGDRRRPLIDPRLHVRRAGRPVRRQHFAQAEYHLSDPDNAVTPTAAARRVAPVAETANLNIMGEGSVRPRGCRGLA